MSVTEQDSGVLEVKIWVPEQLTETVSYLDLQPKIPMFERIN